MDRIRDTGGLGGLRIGRIGITKLALRVLGPDRPWHGGGEVAQQLGFLDKRPVAQVRFRQFPADAAEFANPYNGLAADGAPHGFDRASVRGRKIEQKTFAGLAQCVDRMVHLQRRFRRQPGSEGEEALRLRLLRHQQRRVAGDFRAIVAGRPRNQDLRFREQQRPEPVGLDLQFPDIGAQPRLASGGADAGAHQEDRRHHGEAEQRQRRGQHREFLAIEIERRPRSRPAATHRRHEPARSPRMRRWRVRSGRYVPVMCTTARSDASYRSRPTYLPQTARLYARRPRMIRQSVSGLAIRSCVFQKLERDQTQNRCPLLLIAPRARIGRQYPLRESAGKSPDREREFRARKMRD